jgi:hypothetical protein
MNRTNIFNKNNNTLRNLSNLVGGFGTLPRRALNFAQLGRSVYNMITSTRRKPRRFYNNNGIEINKAEGGWKSPSYNGKIIGQTINMKFLLVGNYHQDFAYYIGSDSYDLTQDFDITSKLNDNDEFLQLRKQALQYKVQNICVSINYCRIPKAGERWNKLMITPETDLIEQDDPLLNKNTMQLDMSKNGTKNYNFRITKRNTEYDNSGWIIGQAQFSGIVKLHLSQLDTNVGDPDASSFDKSVLGTVQVSARIVYIHKDINQSDAKNRTRFTKAEIYNFVNELMLQQTKLPTDSIQDKNDIVDTSTKLC